LYGRRDQKGCDGRPQQAKSLIVAKKRGLVNEPSFDCVVDPANMVKPSVAAA